MSGVLGRQRLESVQNVNPLTGISRKRNNVFYVYAYLDPRKPGTYVYEEFKFTHEPIYIGKGKGKRLEISKHKGQRFITTKIRKIVKTGQNPIVMKVATGLTNEESKQMEIKLISVVGRCDQNKGPLCNLTDGGEGGLGRKITKETRSKMSHQALGRKHSEESRKRNSDSKKGIVHWWWIGRKHSAETKEKMSLQRKGRTHSDETKRKISEGNKGRIVIVSQETRQKLSLLAKNRPQSEETRKKRSISITHWWKNKRSRQRSVQ